MLRLRRLLPLIVVACLLFCPAAKTYGWWQAGHHVIAVLAYELLAEEDRAELLAILKEHPRFAQDFRVPETIQRDPRSVARWQVGVAGYWPDIARDFPEWNRPSWHYQLGSTLVIGERSQVQVPETPGRVPGDANLETRDLHIAQAIELCQGILADGSRPARDRALAICWLAHLVADSHQPCHAGSLYAAKILPDGDRGANSIPIKLEGKRNMHALWDSLLGDRATPNQIRRRVYDIMQDESLMEMARREGEDLQVETWLEESRTYARQYVYTPEVLQNVQAGVRGLTNEMQPVTIDDAYLSRAGEVAQQRAALAGVRLQKILAEALAETRQ